MQKDNNRKIKKNQDVFVKKNDIVKVIRQNNKFADVTALERRTRQVIRKLNKNSYIDIRTGEIKQFQKHDKKEKDSLNNTFNKLRQLIRHNFTEYSKNQLFITLTYAENMTDERRLMKDFEKFIKRLKYKYKEHKLEYIVVAEPQQRKAWHLHLMLKSVNQDNLYIDNKELSKIWNLGYTDTQRLKSSDVGTYYVSYFTDLIEEDNNSNNSKSKKHIKGSRLSYYNKNCKFYRCSRGIKKPQESYEEYNSIIEEFGQATYYTCYDILDEEENVINRVYKASFKKRKEDIYDKRE